MPFFGTHSDKCMKAELDSKIKNKTLMEDAFITLNVKYNDPRGKFLFSAKGGTIRGCIGFGEGEASIILCYSNCKMLEFVKLTTNLLNTWVGCFSTVVILQKSCFDFYTPICHNL